jgi:hypothetical protein
MRVNINAVLLHSLISSIFLYSFETKICLFLEFHWRRPLKLPKLAQATISNYLPNINIELTDLAHGISQSRFGLLQ